MGAADRISRPEELWALSLQLRSELELGARVPAQVADVQTLQPPEHAALHVAERPQSAAPRPRRKSESRRRQTTRDESVPKVSRARTRMLDPSSRCRCRLIEWRALMACLSMSQHFSKC